MKTDFVQNDKMKYAIAREKYNDYESNETPKGLCYIHNRYKDLLSPSAIEEVYEPDVKKDDLFWVPEANDQDTTNAEDNNIQAIEKSK